MSLITPEVNHHFSSGVYAKEAFIPAGKWLVQHAHKFDHLSVLAQGSVELSVDGVVSILHAPTCLTIAAGKHHGVKSLTDVVWYCIHATDCTDIGKIDEILITATDPVAVNLIANTLGREN